MSNWPGQKVGTAPAAQPAPAAPAAPGAVQARPVLSVPNPQQDYENQIKAAEEQRKRLEETRKGITFEQEQADRDQRGGAATTEAEKTAAFLATRVANGLIDLSRVKGADSPELDAEAARFVFGDTAANMFTSADRQRVEAAQRDILDAALTLGTGAAYTAEQLEGYRRSYFPQIGDDDATIADKRARLGVLLEAAKVKAGAAAPAIDKALAAAGLGGGAAQQAGQTGQAIPGVMSPKMVRDIPQGTQVELGFDKMGRDDISAGQRYLQERGLFPNDQAKIIAFWNANSGNQQLTVEGAKQWYEANGYGGLWSDEQVANAVNQARGGATWQGFDTQSLDEQYQQQLDALIAEKGIDPENVGRSGVAGVSSGASLGWNDEILGGLAAVEEALAGGDVVGAYEANRDMRRRIRERAMEENPVTTIAGEIAGGFAIPGMGARNAAARGGQAAVRSAARQGAALGAVAGAGYGEGAGGSVGGALIGAPLGYVVGGQSEKLLRGLRARRLNNSRNNPPPSGGGGSGEAIAAADRLNAATGSNIRMLPADVAGPGIRNVTGGAAKMTISGELIGRASQRLTDEAEKAKNALVGLLGGRAEPEVAGERALEGARKWMRTSATRRDALYARARAAGGDEPVDLANARQVLDGHIAELSQTPGSAAGLERLKALRAELDNPFPVEGVKRMRTRLRDDFGSDGLRATDIERRVGQVIDAAEDDIVTSLQNAGKAEAAKLYQRAAQSHRERVEVIDNVLAPIIGAKGSAPRSGEQIIGAIEQAGRGNSARLGDFMKVLPAEDAALIRGTIIDRLGRASAGQQDETGAAFSLNTFLTNWSKMSDRAKTTMFGGEARAALNDLAKVASARRDSGRYVNFSNTGSVAGNIASGAALAGSVTNPSTLILFGIDGLTGTLLASPRVARWLAKMPENPRAQRAHINNLSKIAAAEPAIAADALGLQQQLLSRLQPGQMPVAAEGQGRGEGRQPQAGKQPQ